MVDAAIERRQKAIRLTMITYEPAKRAEKSALPNLIVSRPESAETVTTLKGDPDGEEVQRLLQSLSVVPGVIETDYYILTRKVIVKYDPKVLTHPRIIQEIEGILPGSPNKFFP